MAAWLLACPHLVMGGSFAHTFGRVGASTGARAEPPQPSREQPPACRGSRLSSSACSRSCLLSWGSATGVPETWLCKTIALDRRPSA